MKLNLISFGQLGKFFLGLRVIFVGVRVILFGHLRDNTHKHTVNYDWLSENQYKL